jgi:predicted CXXCH cytochrome family protein
MTCLSCHNPHISVTQTPIETFNNACINCHQGGKQTLCTEKEKVRVLVQNNCINCHMPMSGSIDIPHVQIHDHFIRKIARQETSTNKGKFVRLACVSDNTKPSAIIQSQAYLNFYEEYVAAKGFLDSAAFYLKNANRNLNLTKKVAIRLAFLRQDYSSLLQEATTLPLADMDAWTAYRVAEALLQGNLPEKAITHLVFALKLKKGELDFMNKLGIAYLQNNQLEESKAVFVQLIKLNPEHVSALTNYGYLNILQGNLELGSSYYQKALALQPDYIPALLNAAGLAYLKQDKTSAKKLLKRTLKVDPKNEKAIHMMLELNKSF